MISSVILTLRAFTHSPFLNILMARLLLGRGVGGGGRGREGFNASEFSPVCSDVIDS